MSNNTIVNLSVLSSLTALQDVNLSANNLQNLTPLSGFSTLTALDVTGNANSSCEELSGIIANNSGAAITAATAGTNCTSFVSFTAITDAGLKACVSANVATYALPTAITALDCSASSVTVLNGLEQFTALQTLNLSDNTIIDLSTLNSLTALKDVNISNNILQNLTPLSSFTTLTNLDVTGNSNSSCEELSGIISNNSGATITAATAGTNCTNYVSFAVISDIGLQNCVLSQVTEYSLATAITALNCSTLMAAINSLSGLEQFINLQILDLSGNTITDLSVIGSLTSLQDLNINGTASDLNLLSTLTNLLVLDISSQAQPVDLFGIRSLPLQELYVSNNQFVDIFLADISGLNGLTVLDISSSSDISCKDLSALDTGGVVITPVNEGMSCTSYYDATIVMDSNLKSCLENDYSLVSNSAIKDVSILDCSYLGINTFAGLEQFFAINELDISGNNISNLTPLATLNNLKILYVIGGEVSSLNDITALNSLPLQQLYIPGNNISDIGVVASLFQLQILDVEDNNIADVSSLAGSLPELLDLTIGGNPLGAADLTAIVTAPKLSKLSIRYNTLDNVTIAALDSAPALIDLNLSNSSGLTDISSLTTLIPKLTRLNFDYSSIADISPLLTATSLVNFSAQSNGISDISNLNNSALQTLDLSGNSIVNISALSTATQIHTLNLSYNTLAISNGIDTVFTNLISLVNLNVSNMNIEVSDSIGMFNTFSASLRIFDGSGNINLDCTALQNLINNAVMTSVLPATATPGSTCFGGA